MKRLLCIVSAMNAGGAETFLMKMYRALDREKYQMDFLVNCTENLYEKEILSLGGKIYVVPAKSQSFLRWYSGTKKVVHDNDYRYVIRVCEHSLAALDLLVSKQGGADHLIMRSSNTSSGSMKSCFLHRLFRFLAINVPTMKLAPSTEAAEYTFGAGCVARGEVYLLHNAIDLRLYHFDVIGRESVRQELGLDGKFVVGHVGRFNHQKNHGYLIDIFYEIQRMKPDAILVLVGQGELQDEIRKKVKVLGIESSVIFTGVRKDVPQMMSAFDLFLFPSFYEGMPNTVIEAQAAGLPCLVSNTITKEANVTGLVTFKPLSVSPREWAFDAVKSSNPNRVKAVELMKENGYGISEVVSRFTSFVFDDKAKGEEREPR